MSIEMLDQSYYRVEITRPGQGLLDVRIAVPETNMAVKFFLGFFVGLSFLGPVVILILVAGDLHRGLPLGLLGMFAIGFWFLRSLLWNAYGREVFHFSPGKLSIVNDYKWFKAPRVTLDTAGENPSYRITNTEINELGIEVKEGLFVFRFDNKTSESSVKVPEYELIYAVKVIRDYLETNAGGR